MKWLLACILAVMVAGYAYQRAYSVKTTYVNGLEPFTSIPGRRFFLESDCYIFKFNDRDSSWPLIGSHATVADLPAEVSESNIDRAYPSVHILGVLRIGDTFRILSVRQDSSRKGTLTTFEIQLSDDTSRKYPRLDAYWIMDHSPEKTGAAPFILSEFAVPRDRE